MKRGAITACASNESCWLGNNAGRRLGSLVLMKKMRAGHGRERDRERAAWWWCRQAGDRHGRAETMWQSTVLPKQVASGQQKFLCLHLHEGSSRFLHGQRLVTVSNDFPVLHRFSQFWHFFFFPVLAFIFSQFWHYFFARSQKFGNLSSFSWKTFVKLARFLMISPFMEGGSKFFMNVLWLLDSGH
jgi:hypothetical protein